jgi:hypothetical protein
MALVEGVDWISDNCLALTPKEERIPVALEEWDADKACELDGDCEKDCLEIEWLISSFLGEGCVDEEEVILKLEL